MGCDHPLEQGTELEVVSLVLTLGQQDVDLVPAVRGPPGTHVGGHPEPDDPAAPLRPGTVEEVWVVPLGGLPLQVEED